jgi:glycosyltransferase involved in cell wall biosynthesis
MRGKGLDLVTLQLLRALRDAGAAVAFLARGRSGLDGVEELGPQANGGKAFCWAPRPYYYGATQRFYSWRAARWLASHACDAVVAWTRTARGLFRQARRQGSLTLLQAGNLHCRCDVGGREGVSWPSISQAYRLDEYALADHIFVASQFAAESFIKHGVAADRLTVLHRGFAPEEFYPAPQHPPVFRVLFCGLIGERKGAHLLIEAWRQCGFSNAELWLVGDVSSEVGKSLRQQAGTDIVLHGFQHDVGSLMRQCRAVVLPSRNEGLAKALIESAACALAIVATPESGFPMCHGASGLQITRSVDSIAAALRQLHDDPRLCCCLGQAARQLALARFNWDAFRDQFAHSVAERLVQRGSVAA